MISNAQQEHQTEEFLLLGPFKVDKFMHEEPFVQEAFISP